MTFSNIAVERHGAGSARVGLIRLDRPQALNALSGDLVRELAQAIEDFERDPDIGAIIVTGSDKAFAAGADIKEMLDKSFAGAYLEDFVTAGWERLAQCRKPTIAAIAGYALGGGCEIAMMCDILIAAENAKFGQPEITIGTIPGAGGSQRLTRAIGKAKAMDMILTGRMMDAAEAERAGLVARIVPLATLVSEAIAIGEKIAAQSRPVALMAKEAVNYAFETGLKAGIGFERRLFHASFALDDRREGMAAFIAKRKPDFRHS